MGRNSARQKIEKTGYAQVRCDGFWTMLRLHRDTVRTSHDLAIRRRIGEKFCSRHASIVADQVFLYGLYRC